MSKFSRKFIGTMCALIAIAVFIVSQLSTNVAANEQNTTTTYVVTASALNVRTGPSTDFKKIGKLYNGETINPISKSGDWYEIEYQESTAYVCASYVMQKVEAIPVSADVTSDAAVDTTTTTATTDNIININTSTTLQTEEISASDSNALSGNASDYLIIINPKYNTLNFYYQGSTYANFACATGKSSTPSPEGKFSICNKIVDRPYYKKGIKGGSPYNPLGRRWMGLDVNGTMGTTYAIHGNSDESSIGKNISGGCIRMHNAEVEALYEIIPIGTTVIIKATEKTDTEIAADYGIVIVESVPIVTAEELANAA